MSCSAALISIDHTFNLCACVALSVQRTERVLQMNAAQRTMLS